MQRLRGKRRLRQEWSLDGWDVLNTTLSTIGAEDVYL